jgi:ribosomal protein L1
MAICILGDQHDIDRAKHGGVDSMSADDLKKLNKNKKRTSCPSIVSHNSDFYLTPIVL